MSRLHAKVARPLRRQIVLIGLFDALERSGVRPIEAKQLHTLWYLTNALATAWGLLPFDTALLKTDRQPYFPSVQSDIDELVGMGMLVVVDLTPVNDGGRLQGRFALNREFSEPVLEVMGTIKEDAELLNFLDDVVQAANRLTDLEQQIALSQDATYGDPGIDAGNVIDLGQWLSRDATTPTEFILNRLRSVAGRDLRPAELMELYVDHLGWRLRHGH